MLVLQNKLLLLASCRTVLPGLVGRRISPAVQDNPMSMCSAKTSVVTSSPARWRASPVGIPDDAVHEVKVHEAEAGDRRAQVKINHILPADPP